MSIYDDTPILIYSIFVAFVFGACMGSFLNCAAYRVVRGESFIKGRSRCTTCGHELGIRDLVPIVSWAASGGRCRYCGDKVSARYPLTELAFALISVLCLMRFDLSALCLRNYIFLSVLFFLTLTDIDDMIIPDGCHVVSVLAWIAAEPLLHDSLRGAGFHILAALIYGGGLLVISLLMDKMTGRDTLGGGDIKLIAACALYLGMVGTLFALIFACIFGLIYNLLRRSKDDDSDKAFPFGPWIALAATGMLLYGEPLVGWYTNLLL